MKTSTTVSIHEDVDVEIDIDEVIEDMSDTEKREFVGKLLLQLKGPLELSDEDKLWQEVRLAANQGNVSRLLSLVSAIAWDYHEIFIDTTGFHRSAAA